MPNIRVDVRYTIQDGSEIKFRSPVDCSAVTGLIVYYPGADGNTTSMEFAFADAHGNNVGDIDHLFSENVVVKAILDVTTGRAFLQNADTNAYLEGHIQSKNNPHGVTASQVGARPNTWTPTASEVGARPNTWTPTASEVGARPNTWTPTASEVGAVAKSELKKFAYSQTDENGNTSVHGIASYPTAPGVFRVVNPVTGLPSGCLGYGSLVIFDGGSYVLHLYQDANDNLYWARTGDGVIAPAASNWREVYDTANKPAASEVGAAPAIESTDNRGCYYRIVDSYTEWINPPMVIGVEYRTTERFLGKPVYTKMVDCGGAEDEKTTAHNVPAGCSIIRFVGTLGYMPLPIDWSTSYKAYVSVTSEKIKIKIGTDDYKNRQVYVQLFYTK